MNSLRDPGRMNTIGGYIYYDQNNLKDLVVPGWTYPEYPAVYLAAKSFRTIIPLKHLLSVQ